MEYLHSLYDADLRRNYRRSNKRPCCKICALVNISNTDLKTSENFTKNKLEQNALSCMLTSHLMKCHKIDKHMLITNLLTGTTPISTQRLSKTK